MSCSGTRDARTDWFAVWLLCPVPCKRLVSLFVFTFQGIGRVKYQIPKQNTANTQHHHVPATTAPDNSLHAHTPSQKHLDAFVVAVHDVDARAHNRQRGGEAQLAVIGALGTPASRQHT